jgi:hypothetical protein
MRKVLAVILVVLAAGAWAAPGYAADYDRYERGYRGEYPPPPPPPPRRAATVPTQRHAQQGEPYFFAHLGVYDPNDETDGLKGYDSGVNFDLGIGSRISPVFAVEGTFGAFGAERGSDEATVVPVTIGGRFIVPNPFIEPYLGAGFGLYFSSLKEDPRVGPPVFSGIDDTSTDFGGYLSLGADFWLNQRAALNVEGKYHWVTPTFRSNAGTDFDVDMGGWTVNLGVRLSF